MEELPLKCIYYYYPARGRLAPPELSKYGWVLGP
jgi:hypothetical protein